MCYILTTKMQPETLTKQEYNPEGSSREMQHQKEWRLCKTENERCTTLVLKRLQKRSRSGHYRYQGNSYI
jgi:hypothetical protein